MGKRATSTSLERWEGVRGDDVAERSTRLAVGVVGLVRRAHGDAIGRHIGLQLVRSVTSAGANYEEARRAESRRDFVHELGVASKELGESLYWLELWARLHESAESRRFAAFRR